jgi:hypothetical protein
VTMAWPLRSFYGSMHSWLSSVIYSMSMMAISWGSGERYGTPLLWYSGVTHRLLKLAMFVPSANVRSKQSGGRTTRKPRTFGAIITESRI